MLMSLILRLRCRPLPDCESSANDISGEFKRRGDGESRSLRPSCLGDVISRVISGGGVDGVSSTMMAGMSTGMMSSYDDTCANDRVTLLLH